MKKEIFDSFDEFDEVVVEKVIIAKPKSIPVIDEAATIDRIAEQSVIEAAEEKEVPKKEAVKKTTKKK